MQSYLDKAIYKVKKVVSNPRAVVYKLSNYSSVSESKYNEIVESVKVMIGALKGKDIDEICDLVNANTDHYDTSSGLRSVHDDRTQHDSNINELNDLYKSEESDHCGKILGQMLYSLNVFTPMKI
jgi:hypothetical protein